MLLVSKWGGGAPKSPFWAPPAALHSYASRRNLVSPLRWLATLHNRMKVFLKPSFPNSPKYFLWPCVRSPHSKLTITDLTQTVVTHLIFDTRAPLFRNFTNHGKKDQFYCQLHYHLKIVAISYLFSIFRVIRLVFGLLLISSKKLFRFQLNCLTLKILSLCVIKHCVFKGYFFNLQFHECQSFKQK